MVKDSKRAHLILRWGLGLFFLVFGVAKFTMGDFWINTYPKFYPFAVSSTILTIIAIIQIAIALMLIFGWRLKLAAGVGGLMHLSTTLVTLPKIIKPFTLIEGAPPNFLFFAAVPVLAAFIALYLESKD